MSGRLRRRYERLLFTYPSAYRRAHGEEMIGTLLERNSRVGVEVMYVR